VLGLGVVARSCVDGPTSASSLDPPLESFFLDDYTMLGRRLPGRSCKERFKKPVLTDYNKWPNHSGKAHGKPTVVAQESMPVKWFGTKLRIFCLQAMHNSFAVGGGGRPWEPREDRDIKVDSNERNWIWWYWDIKAVTRRTKTSHSERQKFSRHWRNFTNKKWRTARKRCVRRRRNYWLSKLRRCRSTPSPSVADGHGVGRGR
jgi:hypothetical protein